MSSRIFQQDGPFLPYGMENVLVPSCSRADPGRFIKHRCSVLLSHIEGSCQDSKNVSFETIEFSLAQGSVPQRLAGF